MDCIKEDCGGCLGFDEDYNMNNRTNYKTKILGKYAMYVEKRIINQDFAEFKTDDLDLLKNLVLDENERGYLIENGFYSVNFDLKTNIYKKTCSWSLEDLEWTCTPKAP